MEWKVICCVNERPVPEEELNRRPVSNETIASICRSVRGRVVGRASRPGRQGAVRASN